MFRQKSARKKVEKLAETPRAVGKVFKVIYSVTTGRPTHEKEWESHVAVHSIVLCNGQSNNNSSEAWKLNRNRLNALFFREMLNWPWLRKTRVGRIIAHAIGGCSDVRDCLSVNFPCWLISQLSLPRRNVLANGKRNEIYVKPQFSNFIQFPFPFLPSTIKKNAETMKAFWCLDSFYIALIMNAHSFERGEARRFMSSNNFLDFNKFLSSAIACSTSNRYSIAFWLKIPPRHPRDIRLGVFLKDVTITLKFKWFLSWYFMNI